MEAEPEEKKEKNGVLVLGDSMIRSASKWCEDEGCDVNV
jgi:hypothetical protein